MLLALELENFKAFGRRTRIELAPITLIFGQNSAGKSSILQALNLLKQTRESREHGAVLLPRAEGGFSDLGSFHELLFDHDPSRSLSIRIDMSVRRNRVTVPRRFLHMFTENGEHPVGYEVTFKRRQEDKEVCLEQLAIYAGKDPLPALKFQPTQLSQEERTDLRRQMLMIRTRRPVRSSELRAAKCISVTKSHFFWNKLYDACKKNAGTIVAALKDNQTDGMPSSEKEEPKRSNLEKAIEFYSRNFSLDEFIERISQAQIGIPVALDGFMAMPLQSNRFHELPELSLDRPYTSIRIRDFFAADAGSIAYDVARLLDDSLEQLFPMGPFRRPAQRWYVFTGTSPQDVGYRGHQLPDLLFRRPELVSETNRWLDRLGIGYHIDARAIGASAQDLFELRLVDKRRGKPVEVGLLDVGFGLSQLLPFVVQSLAAEGQTLTIEQPEVHIHPQLQADLGDLLISTIQEPYNHQFLVETHSEHLILRLLRRIRETSDGTLPSGHPGLHPEQLSVIYVERGPAGSVAHRLRLDEAGEFVDAWPNGFFEERVKELF